MPRQPPPPSSPFEDAIDVPLWLESERATTDLRARMQRDRAIGIELAEREPLRRVRAWWQRVETDARPDLGRRLHRARAFVGIALVAFGFVLGAAIALAVFRYEGDWPVNVVLAMALLAGLPFLMAVLTLLLLPGRVPGLGALQDAVAAINVGNFATSLFNRFAHARATADDGRFELAWPAPPPRGGARRAGRPGRRGRRGGPPPGS
jgi:hypothetical protein